MLVKKNNKAVFEIAVVDNDGDLVTDLATASAIKFQVKLTKSGSAVISKTVGDGIAVNSPSSGHLTLTFLPADTSSVEVGSYFMALQIEYAADDVQEIDLREKEDIIETMSIIEDIIQ